MKPSTSYLAVGLLVATITAILFTQLNMMVFPILGLTCGLVTRNAWRCLAGLITSAGFGFLYLSSSITFRKITPLSTEFGLFHYGNTANYISALLGACLGAVWLLPQGRLVFLASIGCILAAVNFMCVSFLLLNSLPEKSLGVELWEYGTLLVAVPVMSVGMWGPIDLLRKRQLEACQQIFALLSSLHKSMEIALFQSKNHPLIFERAVRVQVIEKEKYDQLSTALQKSRFLLPSEITVPIRRFLTVVLEASTTPLHTHNEEDAAMNCAFIEMNLEKYYSQALAALPNELVAARD